MMPGALAKATWSRRPSEGGETFAMEMLPSGYD